MFLKTKIMYIINSTPVLINSKQYAANIYFKNYHYLWIFYIHQKKIYIWYLDNNMKSKIHNFEETIIKFFLN